MGFETEEIEYIHRALMGHYNMLLTDLPYLGLDDQTELEQDIYMVSKILAKIEENYPGLGNQE